MLILLFFQCFPLRELFLSQFSPYQIVSWSTFNLPCASVECTCTKRSRVSFDRPCQPQLQYDAFPQEKTNFGQRTKIIIVIVKLASAASEQRGRIVWTWHHCGERGGEGRGRGAVMCLRIRQFGGYGMECGMCKTPQLMPILALSLPLI